AVREDHGKGVAQKDVEGLSWGLAHAGERATMSRLQAGAQVTADLVSMGLSPRDATETVGAAVTRGQSQRDIERLRERLGQELKRGGAPEDGAKRPPEAIRSEPPHARSAH